MARGGRTSGRAIRERLSRYGAEAIEFGRYLLVRLVHDNSLQNAATLAYTTLLSIVPLLTVGFSVLAAFPVFEPLSERIRLIIFTNLVPATGEVVEAYVERFISQAAGLTAAGIAGLLVSSLLLMSAIDKALNDIWSVQQRRRPLQGFMVYWTVLTLSPLLVGMSVLLSTYIDIYSAQALATVPRQILLGLMPFFAEVVAFALLYSAVPNRYVPLPHALAGAVLAAVLFELAKLGFAWYVAAFPAFEVIYGALATLPLFLMWIYLVWIIVLTGAEFTQALSGYRSARGGQLSDPRQELLLAVRLLGHLWQGQRRGEALSLRALLSREPEAGELAVHSLLTRLERANVVQRTVGSSWMLARDPHSLTLLDLFRGLTMRLPDLRARTPRDRWDCRLAEVLAPVSRSLEERLRVPIIELYADADEGKTMSKCMRFWVSGRVQGVGYRAGVLEQARTLGLRGYVRNLEDGRVEVLACGDDSALESLQAWLHIGPPLAKVSGVDSELATAPPAVEGFQVR